MEVKITTRLQSFHSRDNIELCLELTKYLINKLNLSREDKRLCLNVRNVRNDGRISVNINSRLVGGLVDDEMEDYFLFILFLRDIEELKKKEIKFETPYKNFSNKGIDKDLAKLIYINKSNFEKEREFILTNWIKCCSDYLPTQTASQYRKHHLAELYELAVDENFRKLNLDSILIDSKNIDTIINEIINEDYIQKIIYSNEYYLKYCLTLYKDFIEIDTSNIIEEINRLNNNIPSPFKYRDVIEYEENEDFKKFLVLIGKIITYFDAHGWNINEWNEYEDKRVISKANLSQDKWLTCFLQFKLNNCSLFGIEDKLDNAFKRSIEYIENPVTNCPITSNNHRNQIATYFNLSSEKEITSLFQKYTNKVTLNENKTVLIVRILYHPKIKKLWMENIIGLMASDGTGWQEETIEVMNSENYDACIIWNSKRPTGTNDTLKKLNSVIEDEGFFYLYYSQSGIINYRAKILDYIENQNQLDKSKWENTYPNILDYYPKMENYTDGKKYASIVFLAEKIEQIEPLNIENFTFYNSSRPTQDNLSPIKSINSKEIKVMNNNTEINHPLNQIFYGSPGTGKTYHTINYALSIIENKSIENLNLESRIKLKERYDNYVNDGRIVFTTFHQSMSYEDFIEGIKPIEPKEEGGNISYRVVDGIFKEIANKADSRKGNFYEVLENFKQEIYEDESKEPLLIKATGTSFYVKYKGGTVFYVSPINTIKTEKPWYPVSIEGIETFFNDDSLIGSYNHTYIREITKYLIDNKHLHKGRNEANQDLPYVIIIDEINRGNVSAIFGELITLIEESKRIGKNEALKVKLPYSKKEFGVPNNLYIIGTMNTADRSVEALDTALRRRFHFVEIQPNSEIVFIDYVDYFLDIIFRSNEINMSDEEFNIEMKKYEEFIINDVDLEPIFKNAINSKLNTDHVNQFVDLFKKQNVKFVHVEILKTINERIEYLLNRDHTIGHSYFLDIINYTELKSAFFKNIIPLLQEYFYGDYAKMSLVIGQGFFEKKKLQKDITWAITDNNIEKPEREVWNLKTNMTDEEFIQAINLLLGKKNES